MCCIWSRRRHSIYDIKSPHGHSTSSSLSLFSVAFSRTVFVHVPVFLPLLPLFFPHSLPPHLTRRRPHLLNTLLRGIHPRQQLHQGSSRRPSINLSFRDVPWPPLCHHLRHCPFTSPIYVTVYILISLVYPPASPPALQLYPITASRGMHCEMLCMCIIYLRRVFLALMSGYIISRRNI